MWTMKAFRVTMSVRSKRRLAVMEMLAGHPAGMTLTEMAGGWADPCRRASLPADAGGHRLCDAVGRLFSLSPRLLTVARTWLGGASLWTFAAPILREVAGQFDEACNAAVLSGEDVVYVA